MSIAVMVLLRELATHTVRLSVARPAGKSSRGPAWALGSCARATKAALTTSRLATRPASRGGFTHRKRVLMGDVPQVLRVTRLRPIELRKNCLYYLIDCAFAVTLVGQ